MQVSAGGDDWIEIDEFGCLETSRPGSGVDITQMTPDGARALINEIAKYALESQEAEAIEAFLEDLATN